ncbi:MAG TPA: ABC transporter permease [Vicinamibacterales bacterium]|nr:ABC transporter permease [Vicinamibacterales bacterium]
MTRDLTYAVRSLKKSPGFTAVAVLTLALGIGANTAIFSVINSVILRPLPYRQPDRLLFLWSTASMMHEPLTPARLVDFRDQLRSVSAIAGISHIPLNLSGMGEPERLDASSVSSSFFDVLGVPALLGDPFHAGRADDRAVVLSYRLWARRFGSDPGIVGRQITLNGTPRTVVAVMPQEFEWPAITPTPGRAAGPQLWIPGASRDLPRTPTDRPDQDLSANRTTGYVRAVARLKGGVTVEQAQREADMIAARIGQMHPDTDGARGALIVPLHTQFYGPLQRTLLILAGAVALVLAIACANVASLLLGRGTARRKEIAIRLALGAARSRVVGQMLIESIVLAIAGGACGLVLAWWAQSSLIALGPPEFLRMSNVRIDFGVLTFTGALSIATGLLFGILPSIQVAGENVTRDLHDGGTRTSTGPRLTRTRDVLVTLQLAVSLVLLVGAILLLRSFAALVHVDTGIATHNLLTFNMFLSATRAASPAQQTAFYEQVLERIRSLPDVMAAGAAVTLPIGGDDFAASYTIEGRALPVVGHEPSAGYQVVTPGYFSAMGIPIITGRDFNTSDVRGGAPVVLINHTLAQREWPAQDPIGRRMRVGADGPWMTVIGVAGDIRHMGPAVPPRAEFYQPYTQRSFSFMAFVVRTHQDPAAAVSRIRSQITQLDPTQPIANVATMDEHVERALSRPRFMSTLIAVFGAVALGLSLVGVYGVMAYSVTQRTREIAIRMALGARTATVVGLILSKTARLTAVGLVVGLFGAVALSRVLSGLLFAVRPSDLPTFFFASLLLGAAALAAGAVPAIRATRIDSIEALKM